MAIPIKTLLSLTILSIFALSASAQANRKCLEPASGGKTFSSSDGLFSVALPANYSSLRLISPKAHRNYLGGEYGWQFKDCTIKASFRYFLNQGYFSDEGFNFFFRDVRDELSKHHNAKITAETGPEKLPQYRLHTFYFENGVSVGRARSYITGGRFYTLVAIVPKENREALSRIDTSFDTIQIHKRTADLPLFITDKIKEGTPKPLPQESAVKKESSDAQDNNFIGAVKTVTEEMEPLTGLGAEYGRGVSLISAYDRRGDLLKEIRFSGNGLTFDITVYGYIDGARVSVSGDAAFSERMRFVIPGEEAKPKAPAQAPDPRYEFKLLYKYAGGRISEMQIVRNNGVRGMRYEYKWSDGRYEWLAYTDDGELNQKYVYLLDDKGNYLEASSNTANNRIEQVTYKYTYDSFDAKGNWTERTRLEPHKEKGKIVYVPNMKEYRTITYYP